MNEQYQKGLKQENDNITAFRRALKALVAKAAPVKHFGDGNCGFVIEEFLSGLSAAGLYSALPPPSKSKKKKEINGNVRTQVFERDMYRCKHCGTHKGLTLDHIHPESKGGASTLENLQTLCRPCNSKKGASA